MNKFLYILLFITTLLNASLIKNVKILEISNKDISIEQAKNSKEFKRIPLPLIRHSDCDYIIKISFDRSKIEDTIKTVEINNEFNFAELEKTINYSNIYKHPTLDISKTNFIETLYIKLHNNDGYVNFNVEVYEKDDYIRKQLILNKFRGVAYGIIFAAFLYYFALFLFNREKSYIYYSLTQFSMLAILVFLSARESESDKIITDIIFFSFFIFSNLFTKSFLNTKKNTPKIHLLLNITIAIYLFDIFTGYMFGYYIFEENLPLSILLIVYLLAGFTVYLKGYKPALFYLIGWSIIIFTFLFIEVQFYFTQRELLIKPIYLIHISTPLESLILAFALSYKMKLFQEEKEQQQHFLSHQSKLASMGEMIGNIAHQWRQPLTHLSYIMMNLKTAFEKEKLTSEYFNKKNSEANAQLEFMSHTIDDFRDFFKVSKQKETFSLKEAIEEVINLLNVSLNSHKIEINFSYENDIKIKSLRGEFLQVIFNILSNAKDEFVKGNIENPKIYIKLYEENKHTKIKISDNAGGIEEKLLEKIFEPYFTTKNKGLGIGLYMSKMIIDKNLNAKLKAENSDKGALFTILFPKN